MTFRLRLVAPVLFAVAAGCGSEPPKAETTKAPPRPKSAAELRADDLIADLKKREIAQAKLDQKPVNATPRSVATPSRPAEPRR
jgi:hypothetical protein